MKPNSIPVSAGQQKFIKKHRIRLLAIHIIRIFLLMFFIGFWEIAARKEIIDSFIFSSPSGLWEAFISYSKDGTLLHHIKITLSETFICFFIVIAGGIAFSILLWWNEFIYKILEPYLVVLNSLPKSALAPLFIVWLGTGMKTIIIAAASVAFFGAVMSLYEHFIETDKEKIRLIYTLGGNKSDVLLKVVLPSNLGFIINVMKVNMGLSLVGVIIGEFVAANAGLGYLILYASQVFRLDLVLLSIVVLAAVASILYLILDFIEKICLRQK